jgi:glycosyltransferase involved in cell wall biosynthesis
MTPLLKDERALATVSARPWIFCQLGAREHYSIPRGLHQRGLLAGLVTEAWVPPNSVLARIGGEFGERLRQRYDRGLADADVRHWSASAVGYELYASISKSRNSWNSIIARNDWFQARAVKHLNAIARHNDQKSCPVVFAYSYAARQILQAARERGCTTVLGQIDPGPVEERIVSEVCLRRGHQIDSTQCIPESYWDDWREECEISDRIIVNSTWTQEALIEEGISSAKIHIVPVAYDPPDDSYQFKRTYPAVFDHSRPLRVLFLGSLIPRKGIREMLDATLLMRAAPVEFQFVGALGTELGIKLTENHRVHWMGPVARQRVKDFYKNADLFILPTHSDGFGLTQLEAMAWGLPVIASRNCGDVVKDKVNGLIIPKVTGEAIAEAIEWCIEDAERLRQMSDRALRTSNKFRSDNVMSQLLRCAGESVLAG